MAKKEKKTCTGFLYIRNVDKSTLLHLSHLPEHIRGESKLSLIMMIADGFFFFNAFFSPIYK